VGEQQRVEILKALYRGADILILDEPTAVLTPQEVDRLFSVFEELIADGKTIIFITHKLGEALAVADRISVLRDGKLVGTVEANATTSEELARMMVGRDVLLEVSAPPANRGDVVLSVSEVAVTDSRGARAVENVSFEVDGGEVFGIAGVDGNGQSELVEAITGLREAADGRISLDGVDITDASRRRRIERGMAFIAEDRHRRSLVLQYDLVRNALLGTQKLPEFSAGGIVNWEHTREYAETVIDEYDVRPPSADAIAGSLSGGNQQKFIVGRELERDPSLVVASHPTRGVDIGSIEFIHNRLLELRTAGVATLLVSSKLEEVRRLSDRMAVMNDGVFVDIVDPDSVTESEIGLLMAGEYPDDYEPNIHKDVGEHATAGGVDA
ncbi:MAG: ABC transporter ATP-binding protein, partial [Halobacteriota archaeon]